MAEAILNHRSKGTFEAKSAGLFAAPGNPASEQTVEVLYQEGIPIDHTSKPLTKDLIDWSDFILTMTEQHKQSIVMQAPGLGKRVYTVKEFVERETTNETVSENNGLSLDVSDPYGGHADIYRQTFKELDALISKLVKETKKHS